MWGCARVCECVGVCLRVLCFVLFFVLLYFNFSVLFLFHFFTMTTYFQ